MAQRTKAQALALLAQLIDDPAGKLWDTANLTDLLSGTVDELWGDLLDEFPRLRSTESSALAPSSPGYIGLNSQLTRFYRIQQVGRASWPAPYTDADPTQFNVIGGVVNDAPCRSWIIWGNQLHVFPYDTTADVYVRYSSLPNAVTDIASDAPIEWPDGFHMAYIYETAARAMEKGDRESSERFSARAAQVQARVRAFLRKQRVGPVVITTYDSPEQWGSV